MRGRAARRYARPTGARRGGGAGAGRHARRSWPGRNSRCRRAPGSWSWSPAGSARSTSSSSPRPPTRWTNWTGCEHPSQLTGRRLTTMFGYRVPAPDQAMLISGGRRGQGGAPFRVVTGHGKFVLPVFRKTRFLTLSMQEAEVAETCVTKQGIALTVTRGHRLQGRQRHREHRQRRPAVPVRPEPDVDADRPHLRRPPALHHRLDDGRGDRHRAPEAGRGGAGHLQVRDGQDRPDRRLPADQVDRRHEDRLHRRHGRPAQGRHPAPGPDRPGPGHPGLGRGPAGGRAQQGRVRPADRDRAGASTRPRSTRRRPWRPRPARCPRPGPSRRC